MAEVVRIDNASLVRQHNPLISAIDWSISEGERWVVLGPNGAGKTTIVSLVAARAQASEGNVHVLGDDIAEASVRELRSQVGLASDAEAQRIFPSETVLDVVLTAAYGVTSRALETYDAQDLDRAQALLEAFGLQHYAARNYGTLSEGERKRVQIARALMADPEILILDEPGAGLDFMGREEVREALTELAASPQSPVLILVTHHLEEIPAGFTHALVMKEGSVVSSGPIAEVVTSEHMSTAFGTPVEVSFAEGRWSVARA